jgi:hypothetical protein
VWTNAQLSPLTSDNTDGAAVDQALYLKVT